MSASAHIATKSLTNSFLESDDLNVAAVMHICRDVALLAVVIVIVLLLVSHMAFGENMVIACIFAFPVN